MPFIILYQNTLTYFLFDYKSDFMLLEVIKNRSRIFIQLRKKKDMSSVIPNLIGSLCEMHKLEHLHKWLQNFCKFCKKNLIFLFYIPFLLNTQISLFILHIYSIKYSFSHFSLEPSQSIHSSGAKNLAI